MSIRKVATIALAAAITLGTAGCTFVSPIASLDVYAPSEGSQVDLGDVKVRNVSFLTDGDKKNVLVGAFVNSGLETASVTLQYEDAQLAETKTYSFQLKPKESLDLGTQYAAALPMVLAGEPGALTSIFIGVNGETPQELRIPVLDGTLAEYKAILDSIQVTDTEAPAAE